jgi:hypothetical protein
VIPERPRDALGRPLPWDADPSRIAPPVPETDGRPVAEVWTIAVGFLAHGSPFHAHEVFEQRWRTCPESDRAAWRAAAQWGAAETHAARGNAVGAQRLAGRALETLASADSIPSGFDADRLVSACRLLAEPSGRAAP